jgi:hypothetical protein
MQSEWRCEAEQGSREGPVDYAQRRFSGEIDMQERSVPQEAWREGDAPLVTGRIASPHDDNSIDVNPSEIFRTPKSPAGTAEVFILSGRQAGI